MRLISQCSNTLPRKTVTGPTVPGMAWTAAPTGTKLLGEVRRSEARVEEPSATQVVESIAPVRSAVC